MIGFQKIGSTTNKMSIIIKPVIFDSDINAVAALAQEIWTQHFIPIVGESQVIYMLEKFQSAPAIYSQLQEGWEYNLAQDEEQCVGYTALIPDVVHRKMMLSKIYVHPSVWGKGVGKNLLDHAEDKSLTGKMNSLWLTVSKKNNGPISWYKRQGFRIIDEMNKDIGGGFFMNDFIMEKILR